MLANGQTDRLTDTLTDANRFYNLSHAICYSYGTDKNALSGGVIPFDGKRFAVENHLVSEQIVVS